MNWLDYTLIIFIAIGTILGLATGPLWQVYRMFSLVISVVGAIVLHPISSSVFHGLFSPETSSILAYSAVFFVILILTYVLGKLFKSLLVNRKFGFFGRILGGGVALLKTTILCCIFISGVSYLGNNRTDAIINDSLIAKNLEDVSRDTISEFPVGIKEVLFDKGDGNIQNSSGKE
ncbi:MAG: CvpA family protein [Candidatus Scalindua sp.]|nr:CvpA family protein [Candidatus Scalindua sp.]